MSFTYIAIGPDHYAKNLSVSFYPIDLSGYHVKVFLNNKLVGDCVRPLSVSPPCDDVAAEIAQKFCASPLDYSGLYPPVVDENAAQSEVCE